MSEHTMKEKYLLKQRDLSEVSIYPKFPKILKIDTCNVCNYHCIFCPNAYQINKCGRIDRDLCLKIIRDARSGGAEELCVSMTGEPLLNEDLELYISFAKSIGYRYAFFNTNGYLLTPERSRSLLEAGIDSIKISVNAGPESYQLIHGQDGWERVLNNIITFDSLRKKYDCALSISYVAVKQTIDEFETVSEAFSNYVDDIFIMNANSRGGTVDKEVQKLYVGHDDFSFSFPCSQLFNNAYVTAEGYLIICCQDFDNLTIVADLHEENIVDAWNNDKFTSFRERYLRKDFKGTLCDNCINGTNESVIPLCESKAHYECSNVIMEDIRKRACALSKKTNKI